MDFSTRALLRWTRRLLPDGGTRSDGPPARAVALLGLLGLALGAVGPGSGSAGDPSLYTVEKIHDNLPLAVGLRFAPDGRIFFLELWTGRVSYFPDTSSAAAARTWATLPVYVGGERGLMGIAFHPQFADSPYVYLFHTLPESLGGYNRVVRLRDSAGVGTQLAVIRGLGAGTPHHNGGRLAFRPDGLLYVTHGDADTLANADDPSGIRGKILRFTPMGEPAPGNPFGAGNPVYAYGIRNSFGLCFDAESGEGYFTDNGPTCDDELNRLLSGGEYGWGVDDFCGGQPPGTILPMLDYTPNIAPTGCWVYRGSGIAAFDGNLFFGGFNDGTLRRVFINRESPGAVDSVQDFHTAPDQFMDVTQGTDGCLWFCTARQLYRVRPNFPVGVAEGARPQAVLSAWPNPFRGSLTLFVSDLPIELLEVLDVSGRVVRRWKPQIPATLSWDGRDSGGRTVSAGLYLAREDGGRPATSAPGGQDRTLTRIPGCASPRRTVARIGAARGGSDRGAEGTARRTADDGLTPPRAACEHQCPTSSPVPA